MGNVEPRAWSASVADAAKGLFASILEPEQVAVGVEGGVSRMVFEARAMLESNPGYVGAKGDKKNAYQELMRAATLDRLEAEPEMEQFAPFFHAFFFA